MVLCCVAGVFCCVCLLKAIGVFSALLRQAEASGRVAASVEFNQFMKEVLCALRFSTVTLPQFLNIGVYLGISFHILL